MRIRFLEIAQIELDEVIEYYNYEEPKLGDVFLIEVLNALDRIGKFPEAWHFCSKRTKRCQTRRFPYGIIYQIRKDEILLSQSLTFTESLIIGKTEYKKSLIERELSLLFKGIPLSKKPRCARHSGNYYPIFIPRILNSS